MKRSKMTDVKLFEQIFVSDWAPKSKKINNAIVVDVIAAWLYV